MTTLITGAGLVGSAVARRLHERGERPVVLDLKPNYDAVRDVIALDAVEIVEGDITDSKTVLRLIEDHDIDAVVHTAGMLGAAVRERPAAGVHANVVGTTTLLEAARTATLRRFVFAGSASVAMGGAEGTEGALPEDISVKLVSQYPRTVYAATKIMCEWLCQLYRDSFGLDTVILRLGAIWGPWSGPLTGLPNQVLHGLLEQVAVGDKVTVSEGVRALPGVDYVYAEDCAQALVRALDATTLEHRVFNVAGGVALTVDDVVEAISRAVGRPITVSVTEAGAGLYAPRSVPMDISLIERELGYTVEYPMENAIPHYQKAMGL